MPELPEVETIRRGLVKNITGKTIKDFNCDWLKMINKSLSTYKKIIIGLKIQDVKRRSKMLIIDLTEDWNILIHLKMTGQLVYQSADKCLIGGHPIKQGFSCLPNKFTHANFSFTDKSQLYFNDIRKFGWLRLYTNKQLVQEIESLKLGPEPLTKAFTFEYLLETITRKPKSKIKQFLMDLHNVVGIGNIYSDEVCYYAKVKPDRLNNSLTEKEIRLIYQGIKKILTQAIKLQGTTFNTYRNSQGEAGTYVKKLKVYGRYGQKCKICQQEIKKTKIAGRTSSYCNKCQK